MLTRVLAVELAEFNIRVNAIAPGPVKTQASWEMWNDAEIYKREVARIPLKRMAEPDEVVGAALFLATDASTFVTGQTIVIDGGINA